MEVDNPDGPTVPNQGMNSDNGWNGGGYAGGFNSPMFGQEPVVEERISAKEEAERWKNRRRLAYISLCAIFVATLLLYFVVPVDRLQLLGSVSEWLYIILGSVVGSYVGSATWHDVMALKTRVGTN